MKERLPSVKSRLQTTVTGHNEIRRRKRQSAPRAGGGGRLSFSLQIDSGAGLAMPILSCLCQKRPPTQPGLTQPQDPFDAAPQAPTIYQSWHMTLNRFTSLVFASGALQQRLKYSLLSTSKKLNAGKLAIYTFDPWTTQVWTAQAYLYASFQYKLPSYAFLNNISFSLASLFSVFTQYIIHITYKVCTCRRFMLSVRFTVNTRLPVSKFWGVNSHTQIFNSRGLAPPTSALFMSQLYLRDTDYWCQHYFSARNKKDGQTRLATSTVCT